MKAFCRDGIGDFPYHRRGSISPARVMPEPLDLKHGLTAPPVWTTERILPDHFSPMLPSAASGPLDSAEYGYEVRWEGLRVLAGYEGPNLVARTGTGQDARFWFPELSQLRAAAEPSWVLIDGEIVQKDGDRVSLMGLQKRLRARTAEEVKKLAVELPAALMVYDVLRIGDSWLLDVTWEERREIMLRALGETPAVRFSKVFPAGDDALRQSQRHGLEAVIAKRLRGRYVPGEKTRDWLSIKPLQVQEAVICGWTEGRGARLGTIGSLILGVRRSGRLAYAGHTGTGIDARTLRELHARLVARGSTDSPFDYPPELSTPPHWVQPEIVCRVRHHGFTDEGIMRGPTFAGLTEAPAEVRAERLVRDRARK
jgi:bifunctional non-homologous end joining protein LigD